MLDEVIEYMKQLQAQVTMMSRMNRSPMTLPHAMQQHLQMSMMGMGHFIDMNPAMGCHPNLMAVSPSVHHPVAHRLHPPAQSMHDSMSTFFAACQSQVNIEF